MKNILVIMGSPRKGDTWKAVERFEVEMAKHGPVQFEYLALRELGLRDCLGCHNCILKGENKCQEREKVQMLVEKIQAADGIILASPVYNQHITALLKKCMDYMTYLWHRPTFFGKRFIGISSGGGMFGDVFKYLNDNVEAWGGTWAGELGVPHYEALTDSFRKKTDASVVKMARVFYQATGDKTMPAPSLGRLMWFQMWRLTASVCRESNPVDFACWNEHNWFKQPYYYNNGVSPLLAFTAARLMGLGRIAMRQVYRDY